MNFSSIELLVLGLFAAFANVLGGLILLPSGVYQKFKAALKYLLALGAGFMLAVTFIELLPKTISLWQADKNSLSGETLVFPMALLLGGYLLTQFFEHTIAPHFISAKKCTATT
jgi:zinc transporter ZupT